MCRKIIYMLVCLFSIAACGQSQKKDKHQQEVQQSILPDYDLSKPQIFKLPPLLDEISGIAFRNGNGDTVYAEQDEAGKLFRFALGNEAVKETKFGKKGDYEDVQLCNNYVIMLRSDGTLYTFPVNEIMNQETDKAATFKDLLPAGEYEGMYADNTSHKLYVLCKNCHEKLTKTVTVYTLQIDNAGSITPNGNFTLNAEDIAGKAGKKKAEFHPSALAWSYKSNQWFIVSSVNKMLVLADKDWNIQAVSALDASVFNQPEGIAFDNAGNLYISNEKGNNSSATILKFNYKLHQ